MSDRGYKGLGLIITAQAIGCRIEAYQIANAQRAPGNPVYDQAYFFAVEQELLELAKQIDTLGG